MRKRTTLFILGILAFITPILVFFNALFNVHSRWEMQYFNSDSAYIPVLCHDLKDSPYYFFEWDYPRPNFIFPDVLVFCTLNSFLDTKTSMIVTSIIQYITLFFVLFITLRYFTKDNAISFYLASFGVTSFVLGIGLPSRIWVTLTTFVLAIHAFSYSAAALAPYLAYKALKGSKKHLVSLATLSMLYVYSDPLSLWIAFVPSVLVFLLYRFPKNTWKAIVLLIAITIGLVFNFSMPCDQSVGMRKLGIRIFVQRLLENLYILLTDRTTFFLVATGLLAFIINRDSRLLIVISLLSVVTFAAFRSLAKVPLHGRYLAVLYAALLPAFVLAFKKKEFLVGSIILLFYFLALHLYVFLSIKYWSLNHYYKFTTVTAKFLERHKIKSFDGEYWIAKRDTLITNFKIRADSQHLINYSTYKIMPYFHMMNVYKFLIPVKAYLFGYNDGSFKMISKAINVTLGRVKIVRIGRFTIALANSFKFKYWMASHPSTINWIFAQAWRMAVIKRLLPFMKFPKDLLHPKLKTYWFEFNRKGDTWRYLFNIPPGTYVFKLNVTTCKVYLKPHRSHRAYVYYVKNLGSKAVIALGKTLYRIIHDFKTFGFGAIGITEWNMGTGFRIPVDVTIKCNRPFELTIARG